MNLEQLLRVAVAACGTEGVKAKVMKECIEAHNAAAEEHFQAVDRLVAALGIMPNGDGKPHIIVYKDMTLEIYLGNLIGRRGWLLRPLEVKVVAEGA